ncbi:S8 family serine peptidase [Actinoplanes sp. CA-142083]|uniref:S8 family serine peptidase n=1 Tax=Actinoplanes sp. CA-142083 TaxID=3239903 RepID=UPI003D89C8BC
MSSLDPAFEELLDRMSRRQARFADEPEPRVDVHVLFTGSIDALVAVGFTPMVVSPHPRREATVAAGTVPAGRLRELADLDQVEFVEAPARHEPLLEESVPDIRADVVQRPPLSLTGRDVIVAVVDGGFDLTHPTFRKQDNSSRVLAYWDQDEFVTAPATGAPPQPFNFGWAWDNGQITAALQANPLPSWLRPHFPPRDAGESDDHYRRRQQKVVSGTRHGTHVAGIAAGNGRGRTGCVGNHFVGVAPEADLILIRCRRTDDPNPLPQSVLTYALNFIWRIADDLDRPVVVNYSRGSNAGPHDGNTVEEVLVEAALLPFAGNRARALVVAAGNEGDADHHARATVAPGGAANAEDVEFTMPDAWPDSVGFEIWYPGTGDLEVAFVVPGLLETLVSPFATPDGPEVSWTFPAGAAKPNKVTIRSFRNNVRNHDNWVWIDLTLARTEGLPSARPARFAIRLANTEPVSTSADIWALTFDKTLMFTSHQTAATTVTTPATANRAIAVGSYNKPLIFGLFGGGIADYSSRGPVRGPNPDHIEKPDLTAPGTKIYSARADIGPEAAEQVKESYGEICDCCTDEYMTNTGTSMAAPHVAGVIALMMQREPTLQSDAFQPRLRSTARRPDGNPGPSTYDPVWGYGKVDAANAVSPNLPAPPPVPAPLAGSGAGPRPGPGTPMAFVDRLAGLPETATLTALISLHFAEARALIDGRPRVAVTWHRLEGPRLLRGLRTLADVPPGPWRQDLAMDLAPVRGRVRAFLDALARNGSAALRRDIAAHGDALLALLAPEPLTRVARAAGLIG